MINLKADVPKMTHYLSLTCNKFIHGIGHADIYARIMYT